MKSIAKAFISAKKEFAPAMKTSTNPHFKSKYADLAACVEAVDDAFLNNNIVMYQETFEDITGVTVETVLLHESGELIRCGKLHVPASKQDPQGYGSALSYARRYSLMAACGIAPEDDDGNAAKKSKEESDKKKAELDAEHKKYIALVANRTESEWLEIANRFEKAVTACKTLEAYNILVEKAAPTLKEMRQYAEIIADQVTDIAKRKQEELLNVK